jgi:hypothetical protein
MRGAWAATSITSMILATLAPAARAQQVRGEIRDSATAFVIPGAVASLFDAAGTPLTRTIADQFGRYRLTVPASATRLQILRIGYRPRELRLPPVSGDTTITIDVTMVPVPKFLAAVQVSDRPICPERESGGEALALWEQARAGLLAMIVARTERPAHLRNLVYERAIDPRSGKIMGQTVKRSSGTSHQSFVASRPAADFARLGYMYEDASGRTYYAPDADVLLDPSFMTAHCFRIQVDDRQHPQEIGLAFTPAPGRDSLVDVAGVVWLDRSALDLRIFEFRYTGLEPAATSARAGGMLSFQMMPNGVVFIERWNILMPLLGRNAGSSRNARIGTPRADRRDVFVSGLHESGGELARAAWPDAQWKGKLGQIRGRVIERGTGRPLANVRITLDGTSDQVVTDTTGSFTIDELLPGPYTLRAADTVLAEFEISQSRHVPVEISREKPLDVQFEWPTIADVIQNLCREERGPPGAAILGRVTSADGWPIWEVVLSAAWQADFQIAADRSIFFRRVSRSDRSNSKGVFSLCNIRREERIGIRATFAPNVFTDTTVVLGKDEVFTILRLTRPAPKP